MSGPFYACDVCDSLTICDRGYYEDIRPPKDWWEGLAEKAPGRAPELNPVGMWVHVCPKCAKVEKCPSCGKYKEAIHEV